MCAECQVDPLIDCSDEARAHRREQIANLRDLMVSVVTSVSDRGRSVSYNYQQIGPALQMLMGEEYYCTYGRMPATGNLQFLGPPMITKGFH